MIPSTPTPTASTTPTGTIASDASTGELARLVLDASRDGIVAFKSLRQDDGTIRDFEFVVMNRSAMSIVSVPSDDLLGRELRRSLPHIVTSGLFARLCDVVESGRPYHVDYRMPGEGDEWYLLSAAPLGDGFTVTFRDISRSKRLERELAVTSMHDELTGLPNRALLQDRLGQAIRLAARHRRQPTVFVVDIDRFGQINENFGYANGDRVIVEVARRLRDVVRSADTVARTGGDEFVVVCESLEDDLEVSTAADRILRSCEFSLDMNGDPVGVTVSVGGAIAEPAMDAMDAVRAAHSAMHRAKTGGRNRSEFLDEELRADLSRRSEIAAGLARALTNHEFELFYQPLFDRSHEMTSAEALIRWRRSGNVVPPDDFLEIAEECGLTMQLGEFVLRTAIGQIARWDTAFGGVALRSVAVNLAAAQLSTPGLADLVCSILAEHDVEPSRLCLEVTESSLIADPLVAEASLRRLADHGVRIALDDFGTGYSPLSYLRRFPVDTVKIDRSFVGNMLSDPSALAVADAVTALSHRLGKAVVAEGVETEEQRDAVLRLGVDEMQGFLFSKPVCVDDFTVLLVERSAESETFGRDSASPMSTPDPSSSLDGRQVTPTAACDDRQVWTRVDDIPIAAAIIDDRGMVAASNAALCQLVGGDPTAGHISDLVRESSRAELAEMLHSRSTDRTRLLGLGGEHHGENLFEFNLGPRTEEGTSLLFVVVQQLEVEVIDELASRAHRLLGQGVVIGDGERLVHVSDAAAKIYGRPAEELVGMGSLFGLFEASEQERLLSVAAECEVSGREVPTHFESVIVQPDGTHVPVELFVKATVNGRSVRTYTLITDATERRANQQRLAHMATHDQLTGLPNRYLLHDRLDHTLGRIRRTGAVASLTFVDLDHFKRVNDEHGHAVGDSVLRVIGDRLAADVGECDFVARVGGDEFVVLCDEPSAHDGATIDELIRSIVSRPIEANGVEVEVEASVGWIEIGDADTDCETLLARSDAEMYRGRDRRRSN